MNENLEKLVQHARDKKPTDFKSVLTTEIDNRIDARVTEIRDDLSKNMFKFDKLAENCEGHPDGVEHTHDDGTVHTHEGGDKPHTHDEEVEEGKQPWSAVQAGLGSNYDKKKDGRNAARKAKRDAAKAKKGKKDDQDEAFSLLPDVKDEKKAKKNPKGEGTLPPALQKAIDAKKKGKGDEDDEKDEGTLPPALQKAIDAKKKNNSKADDVDKSPEDDEDEDKKKDENLDNFNGKKAKPFKKDTKEDIRATVKKILRREASGDKAAYQKKRDEVLKKYGVKACGLIKDEKEKKQCFQDLDDAHVADHEED